MNEHSRELNRSHGHIELICGSMFSGKTEELISRISRAEIAKQRVQVFSHNLDTRYGESKVASHSGANTNATPIKTAKQILEKLDPQTTVVAIDEAQFFDWQIAEIANELANRGIRVILAGLDVDFRGEPFGPMPLLMAQAEQIEKLSAICVVCGEAASRTQRLINGKPAQYDDPVILVGAAEVYEARCRLHHSVPGRPASREQ